MRPKSDSSASTVPTTTALQPGLHRFGDETWEIKRERLDAQWTPLLDEKNRRVHGWALIEETPAHMLGRELIDGSCSRTINVEPFSVELIATRDNKGFGALSRSTRYATREGAISAARRALAAQGKRYAKKYERIA